MGDLIKGKFPAELTPHPEAQNSTDSLAEVRQIGRDVPKGVMHNVVKLDTEEDGPETIDAARAEIARLEGKIAEIRERDADVEFGSQAQTDITNLQIRITEIEGWIEDQEDLKEGA
jgi:hypothetical protein